MTQVFSSEFCEILRTSFLQNTFGRLLLKRQGTRKKEQERELKHEIWKLKKQAATFFCDYGNKLLW